MRDLALIMKADGTPATVQLAMRESQSGGGRVKAVFTTPIEEGLKLRGPEGQSIPLVKIIGSEPPEQGAMAMGGEFRIETAS